MGRAKEYRQRLKYQVTSAKKKTLENLLSVQFRNELGLSEVEARLLGHRISSWILSQPELRGPNQIYLEASKGRESFARRYMFPQKIKLTPFAAEDLDLEIEFGLSTMQLGRIMRLIEEAYCQDTLLSTKQLTLLCHITPTSLRNRLKALRGKGIWVPVKGLSRVDREKGGCFRSTQALKTYLEENNLTETRRALALSTQRFREILTDFTRVAKTVQGGGYTFPDPEKSEWAELALKMPEERLLSLLEKQLPAVTKRMSDDFWVDLQEDFSLSPVKQRAIREATEKLLATLSQDRTDGEVVYWAVSSREPAGKPLEACQLVPVTLSFFKPEDMPPTCVDRDVNRVSDLKFQKVLRFTTQAKHDGGYLTYADLSYLLGIHPEAISRLVSANSKVVVPLRGAECDIGRGITHRQEIIRLYLEMHTETEIAARTGHSYESIEAYIKEFAAIFVLKERGLPMPLIRRVTGRSTQLIRAYLELIHQYSGPEYAFRFYHMKKIFAAHEEEFKKNPREKSP